MRIHLWFRSLTSKTLGKLTIMFLTVNMITRNVPWACQWIPIILLLVWVFWSMRIVIIIIACEIEPTIHWPPEWLRISVVRVICVAISVIRSQEAFIWLESTCFCPPSEVFIPSKCAIEITHVIRGSPPTSWLLVMAWWLQNLRMIAREIFQVSVFHSPPYIWVGINAPSSLKSVALSPLLFSFSII